MKSYSSALTATGVLLLSIGILLAANVRRDYDHNVDFGQYKTYTWLKVEAGDTLWSDRIRESVDKQLAAKGWTRAQSGAGAAVAALGSTRNQQTLETFYNGFGGGWFWRGFGDGTATTTVQNERVGTLLVDIFD